MYNKIIEYRGNIPAKARSSIRSVMNELAAYREQMKELALRHLTSVSGKAENIPKNCISIRLPNGFHLNEDVVKEVLHDLLRTYRYPNSKDSPVRAVVACVLREGKVLHYLSDDPEGSHIINTMNKRSFKDKRETPEPGQKNVLSSSFLHQGRLSYANPIFRRYFTFYAKSIGWKHYIPVYVLNADKTEISGVIMIMTSGKGIFTNIAQDHGKPIRKIIHTAISAHGQQRAMDPEVFLEDVGLRKLNHIKWSTRFNLATYGLTVWTVKTFAQFLCGLDLAMPGATALWHLTTAKLSALLAQLRDIEQVVPHLLAFLQSIDYATPTIDTVYSPILNITIALLNILLLMRMKRTDIREKNEEIIKAGARDMKIPEKFDLHRHMYTSDMRFFINEYVQSEYAEHFRRLIKKFFGYINDNGRLEKKKLRRQLVHFRKRYRPLTGGSATLNAFHTYLRSYSGELRGDRTVRPVLRRLFQPALTPQKTFRRFALQFFLERHATQLTQRLQEHGLLPEQFIPQDARTIVQMLFFNTIFTKESFPKNDIKQISYEMFVQTMQIENLSRPIASENDVWALCLDYVTPHSLKALKIKLSLLEKKKYQKDLILLTVIDAMYSQIKDRSARIALKQLRADILQGPVVDGIFEKEYWDTLPPHLGDQSDVFLEIKRELDLRTDRIKRTAGNIRGGISDFFDEHNSRAFFGLRQEEQQYFFRLFILGLQNAGTLTKEMARAYSVKLHKLTFSKRSKNPSDISS